MVANKFLEDVDVEDDVRLSCVSMCKYFHERWDSLKLCSFCMRYILISLFSVRRLSASFWDVLRRRNYVTPTSYLELILTFKSLLGVKRSEVKLLLERYLNGLDKLSFAASQVWLGYNFSGTAGKNEILNLHGTIILSIFTLLIFTVTPISQRLKPVFLDVTRTIRAV